jgi:hypothetical protein
VTTDAELLVGGLAGRVRGGGALVEVVVLVLEEVVEEVEVLVLEEVVEELVVLVLVVDVELGTVDVLVL